ncbi:hypothetical protein L798_02939 [Zootermopsis nevadensis]|uniref:Uncharacterized protein n=1 Tax=Zootermopsis nevadensis TaxID=136037 RepID=A0A067QU40_ZOONE|nr:hypothetical protein L798_02939 [Zootermopsis nevadensis]
MRVINNNTLIRLVMLVRRYIVGRVTIWVQRQGGWAVVLQQSVINAYRIAVTLFCCFGIVAICAYIRNNRR